LFQLHRRGAAFSQRDDVPRHISPA
jgi:hypothetical protein